MKFLFLKKSSTRFYSNACLALALTASLLLHDVTARARLIEPPMRSSYWREGVPEAAVNSHDELLNCGGYEYQWTRGKGKCGACGDRFDGFLENEYPGKYSMVPPQRVYTSGGEMNVTVYTNANMLGYFVFRLCTSRDGPHLLDLNECFTRMNPLIIKETKTDRYYPGSKKGFHDLHVILPKTDCDQCILQWTYVTGYREHSPKPNCEACLGCGPQETYVNCADISILREGATSVTDPESVPPARPIITTTTTTTISTTRRPAASTTTPRSTTSQLTRPASTPKTTTRAPDSPASCSPMAPHVVCEPRGIHKLIAEMDTWCLRTCQSGRCRADFCSCYCKYPTYKIYIEPAAFDYIASLKHPSSAAAVPSMTPMSSKHLCYKATPLWSKTPGLNGWCSYNCPSEWCEDMCSLQVCP
ncbi:uncharacterized protein LOC131942685 [Physella acuta]|uniref:uncharacterized protein LOC131942685 n=1 Tax=Physella acuta TaxID=109671 RepID=UPI0027DB7EFC|nr:uncharacterized protein LOC131942685 [Physella acuta]